MNMFAKLIIIFLCFFSSLYSKDLKKVNIQLSWFNQFQFAGYFIAKEKGFYEDLGLDVQLKEFHFGLDIPKEVSQGVHDFSIGKQTLILEKSKGLNIKALFATFQSTPLILITTKESKINKIEDLKNKTIMTTNNDASEVSIKAMIKSKNINLNDLNFIKHSHNINDLIEKKTDVMSAYISKAPYVLEKKAVEYNIFDPKQFGFDMYSDLLYTSDTFVKNDLATVLAVKEASLKGWKYAYENIEETVDLILKKYNIQNLSKDELLYEAKELKKLSFFNTQNFGEIKKDKLQRVFDLYNIMGLTSNIIDYDDFVLSQNENEKLQLNIKQKKYLLNKKQISMCVIPNALPYSIIKKDKFEGLIADLVKLVEEKLSVPFVLVKTKTWEQSLQYIKEKKCDILPSVQVTKSRKTNMNFTKSYISIPAVIVTKNDIPFIENLKELKDVKIGLTKGFSLYEILKDKYPKIEFVFVNSFKHGLKKVQNEEIFGQITSVGTAWYVLQNDISSGLKISGKIDEPISLGMAVRNDDIVLKNIINRAVDSISLQEIEKINSKWKYIHKEKEFDYVLFSQVFIFISMVIFFLLYRQYFLNKMNKKLNKKVEEKTQELIKINSSLEEKINIEVQKNLKKDIILAEQSKMAAMGRMIENIAHQWRQPLSLISTGASGIKVKKEIDDLSDEFFHKTLDSIIESSKYLSRTIDDFRFFFKPDEEKREFYIQKVFNKTINLLESKFEYENIKVEKKLEDILIKGHETQLIQVFINILNNAKDALENQDLEEKIIFIESKIKDNNVEVSILDNAGGIDKSVMPKIFEPYFTTKHSSKGTGVGLYMCEQIISKYMNGRIEVLNEQIEYKNKKYQGAKFTIIFPYMSS